MTDEPRLSDPADRPPGPPRGVDAAAAPSAPAGVSATVSTPPAPQVAVAPEHSRAILDAAFASSQDAIIIFRARDERIVDVNAAWSRTTGYAREQVVGRDQRSLDIWRDPQDSARLADHLAEHGSVDGFQFAFTRHRPDGGTELGYAVLTAQPVVLDGETYVVAESAPGRGTTVTLFWPEAPETTADAAALAMVEAVGAAIAGDAAARASRR